MKYFCIDEFLKSQTAIKYKIDNRTPFYTNLCFVENYKKLVDNILDPARELLGAPIIITSGFRCPELNKIVGGTEKSQHLYGQAADIVCENMRKLFKILQTLDFDQLIVENGWFHISYKSKENNRRQII